VLYKNNGTEAEVSCLQRQDLLLEHETGNIRFTSYFYWTVSL